MTTTTRKIEVTQRNGKTRSVETELTDKEAVAALRLMASVGFLRTDFALSLARQKTHSAKQIAWVHIIVIESTPAFAAELKADIERDQKAKAEQAILDAEAAQGQPSEFDSCYDEITEDDEVDMGFEKALAEDRILPPVGSWAETARMMATFGDDDGMDWDAWKDEMKEGRF